MAKDSEPYVLFEVAGTTYAVESSNVQHIEMVEKITIVPNTHKTVDGVVFSRGQVMPALNLRARFGFERAALDARTRIIFVKHQQRVVGLVADSAREFRDIPASSIRPVEETLTGVAGNYLKGVTMLNERLAVILDLEAVLNLEFEENIAEEIAQLAKQQRGTTKPPVTPN